MRTIMKKLSLRTFIIMMLACVSITAAVVYAYTWTWSSPVYITVYAETNLKAYWDSSHTDSVDRIPKTGRYEIIRPASGTKEETVAEFHVWNKQGAKGNGYWRLTGTVPSGVSFKMQYRSLGIWYDWSGGLNFDSNADRLVRLRISVSSSATGGEVDVTLEIGRS